MTAITLKRDGTPVGEKQFAWSYSKLKNYEICPLRYFETDVKKLHVEKTEHLDWGDRVHKTAAAHLSKGEPLPDDVLAILAPWMVRIKNTPGELLVEKKFALTKDLRPTTYFGNDVWYRGVVDTGKIYEDVGLAIDWKTGKITKDSVQLALMAQCMFSHYPQLQKIRTEFIWLAEDATTREDFSRTDLANLWPGLRNRVNTLENSSNSNLWPMKPNKLCGSYCRVETCFHHGKKY